MNILHLVAFVGKGSGGLGPAILDLAAAQQRLGHHPTIWCLDYRDASAEFARKEGIEIRVWPRSRPYALGFSAHMERTVLQAKAPLFDVVHQHGIWLKLIHTATLMKQKFGTPTCISPEGSLSPYCLHISRWKKRIALALYQQKNLDTSSSLLCVTQAEAGDCERFGLRNPIAVVPHGISDQWLASEGSAERFRETYAIPRGKRIMLFLSRVHPQKGLPLILSAMRSMPAGLIRDWVLVIAGPDQNGHAMEIQSLSTQYGLAEQVKILGPLYDQAKRDAFAAAELFVLPSYSEAWSIAVLEALALSLPVLTTTGTPWKELADNECGWWVSPDAGGMQAALSDALSKDAPSLKEMGTRGRALVEKNYTLQSRANRIIEVYSRLIGQRKPADASCPPVHHGAHWIELFDAPWKILNHLRRVVSTPRARAVFLFNGIHWGKGWRLFGCPVLMKHKGSSLTLGDNLQLRSTIRSNPLSPQHPVVLCTWRRGATLEIGDHFSMSGGTICAAQAIRIGANVTIGANSIVADTDFHPIGSLARRMDGSAGESRPVVIGDDVFIGMGCLILKGVTIGEGSVIGAGSVVSSDIPANSIAAGVPARVLKHIDEDGAEGTVR